MSLIPDVHDAAYGLFETRSWYGQNPIHGTGGQFPEGTVDAFRREFKSELEMVPGEDGKKK